LKRKTQVRGLAGVALLPDGVALSRIHRTTGQPPQLLDCHFQPVANNEQLAETLTSMVNDAGLAGASTAAVLPLGGHSLMLVEAPDVPPTEMKNAMRWRIKDLIDFHVDDAVIDVFEIPGQEAGRSKLMYAVAARAANIRRNVDTIEASGLELDVIDIPELALRNITSLLEEDVSGVAFLYLSPQGGVITLTRQSVLYLSRNLEFNIADILDHAAGNEMDTAAQQLLDSIVLQTQRSLDYYESHFSQPPISHMVVAPMHGEIPGMLTYIANGLGISVRALDLNSVLDVATPVAEQLQSQTLLAIGAALRTQSKAL
jgi:MSHA biogenesis protein MshI